MDFITYTNNWLKGEIFEGTIIAIFGTLVFLSSIVFWKFGSTPASKSLILPLIIVGAIFISSGVSMYFSNQKRLVEYQQSYQENKTEFIQQEKERVESFQYMYTLSKILATVGFLVTLIAFWLTKSSTFQGIAIGLAILGFASLVIDFFSEERASIYYDKIELVLNKK